MEENQNETMNEETVSDQEVSQELSEQGGESTDGQAAADAKRPKKLQKGIEGTVVKITVIGGEQGEMSFDSNELPEEVKAKLVPFGVGHKLGDAAAGRNGKEAEEAIQKVWEGLVKGDWTTRAPAAQKVSVSDITANLSNLSPEEQETARAMLVKMGILK